MSMLEITTDELAEKLAKGEAVNLIDVREEDEVATGAIPGIVHIPLGEVESRLSELDKEKDYIVICRSGGRSGRATEILTQAGYKATNMVGGMLDWSGETV